MLKPLDTFLSIIVEIFKQCKSDIIGKEFCKLRYWHFEQNSRQACLFFFFEVFKDAFSQQKKKRINVVSIKT